VLTAIGLCICMYVGIRMVELAFNREVAHTVRTLGVAGVIGAVYFAAVIVTAAREIDLAPERLTG
jgi:L-cystine uptake protein TcyP (sodium:dicarboxylate symporter family)